MAQKGEINNYYGGDKGENLVARSVVVIGGEATIPLNYSLTMNSYLESDSVNIDIPTELLDLHKILKTSRQNNSYVEVEIWSGWLNSQTTHHTFTQSTTNGKSNDQIKKELLSNFREKLSLRWFGLIDTPSMSWSQKSGDMISLSCKELFSFLQDYAFEKKYEGSKASVEEIIKDIKGQLKGSINILIDKGVPEAKKKLLMGLKINYISDKDDKKEEIKEYNTVGKSYWDVIVEICKKAKLQFIQSENDLKTYVFLDHKTSSTLWSLDRVQDFTDCKLTEGKVGSSNANKVGIIVRSKQTGKTDAAEFVEVTFPKDLSTDSPESTKIKIITIGNDKTKEQCQEVAFDKAALFAKQSLTGSVTVPNAITKIKPNHLLNIKDTSPLPVLRRITLYTGDGLDNMNFKITSITENFSMSGYSQSLEFELEPTLNLIDDKTGEIKGYKLFPKTTVEDKDLKSTDMRMIDITKMPLRLLLMRDAVSRG